MIFPTTKGSQGGFGVFDMEFFYAFLSIFLVDIVLSGDNAVVIALASRNLPEKQRTKAIFWGSFGAITLRIVLTLLAVSLLQTIPLLHFVGGLLLTWIAYKLLNDDDGDENVQAASGLGKAIQTIIIADFVMSLDNVLAIAAIAQESLLLIIIGLGISMPLMIWGSSILTRLMGKFPIIVWAGAGLLAWTAGDMMNKDTLADQYVLHYIDATEWVLPFAITVGVLAISIIRRKTRRAGG